MNRREFLKATGFGAALALPVCAGIPARPAGKRYERKWWLDFNLF